MSQTSRESLERQPKQPARVAADDKCATDNEPHTVSRTRFVLERRVDPVALVALLLSLGAIVYQFVMSLAGAQIALIQPEQVEVRDNGPWVIVHAPMSYWNAARYNGVVISETATLELPQGDRSVTLHWQSFILTDPGEADAIDVINDAQPFVVEGNGATSHQTAFYPRNVPCLECSDEERFQNYLRWEDLLTVADTADRLNLTFTAEQIEGKEFVLKCYMPLDDNMRRYMRENGIFTRTCVPIAQ